MDASWLVGCDGAQSTVRKQLGCAFEGETMGSRFVLADVHVAGLSVAATELAIFWHQDGVLVFFPIAPGRYRVIADMGRWDPAARQDPTLADIQAIVDQRGPGSVVLSSPVWLSPFGINERMVTDYRRGHVFLAGDAAHIHSPAGGQGMNTGMQDAFNLAWKLALAMQGLPSAPALLDSYSSERCAVGWKTSAGSRGLRRRGTRWHSMSATWSPITSSGLPPCGTRSPAIWRKSRSGIPAAP
jgi:2-polyprenyl-6-methoxyphenol hydroxylase-like FAD-dependent oxidoreductase